MKPFLFLLLLIVLFPCLVKAQDYTPPVKTGFGSFEYTCYKTDRWALDEYPWRALDSNVRYMDEYGNWAFAYRIAPDSFTVVENALFFNRITRVDTLHKGKKDMCLVVYGYNSIYGSGGGTMEEGIIILQLNPRVVLFRAINRSTNETFERRDVKRDMKGCSQDIKLTGSKLVIKKAWHSSQNHMEFGCGIDEISPGTYLYKNGSFQKISTR